MQYIGNHKELITDEMIDYVTTNNGCLLPDDRECLLPDFSDQNRDIHNSWDKLITWHCFESVNLPFVIDWPVDTSNAKIDWWVIKLKPGQGLPMHVDPDPEDTTDRYVLCLQDYEPGHILLWDNELLKDYKKGDLFKVTHINGTHGSSNISNSLRLIAHLTVWHNE
jgi:hypothetical protein